MIRETVFGLSFLLSVGAFANECIDNIAMHTDIKCAEHCQFDMRDCHLRSTDISQILEYLNEHPQVIAADLSQNAIDSDGAELLFANSTLKYLNLNKNLISTIGMQAIANNTSLIALDLDANPVDSYGAQALANHSSIKYLSLANSQIGDEGAKALTQNTILHVLILDHNNLSNDALKYIGTNPSLTALSLRGNNFDKEGAVFLEQMSRLSFNSLKDFYDEEDEEDEIWCLKFMKKINGLKPH